MQPCRSLSSASPCGLLSQRRVSCATGVEARRDVHSHRDLGRRPSRLSTPTKATTPNDCNNNDNDNNNNNNNQASTSSSSAEPDLITRIFGGIFGKSALEDRNPGGMRRLEGAALFEQYPATVDEWAEPLPGDSAEITPLRRLLKNTRLEKEPLELAFDAERDGWSCESFLAKVATRGANVVVAETEGGAVIGGYAPRSWLGLGEEKSAMAAFLFTWPEGLSSKEKKQKNENDAIKLPKVGGAGLALVDRPGVAIQFGAEGLIIPLNSQNGASERMAKCRLGTYYARIPSTGSSGERAAPGGRSLFSPRERDLKKTELVSLKVYVASGAAEKWDLDGVVWKTGSGGQE